MQVGDAAEAIDDLARGYVTPGHVYVSAGLDRTTAGTCWPRVRSSPPAVSLSNTLLKIFIFEEVIIANMHDVETNYLRCSYICGKTMCIKRAKPVCVITLHFMYVLTDQTIVSLYLLFLRDIEYFTYESLIQRHSNCLPPLSKHVILSMLLWTHPSLVTKQP
jgi:hypothetical protein